MESKEVLVDSDIIIDHLREQSETLKQLSEEYSIAISTVVAFELYYGSFKGGNSEDKIQELLTNMRLVSFNNKQARRAAKLRAKLESGGNPLEIRDVFIAATALANKLPLATRNKKHYQRISDLYLIEL